MATINFKTVSLLLVLSFVLGCLYFIEKMDFLDRKDPQETVLVSREDDHHENSQQFKADTAKEDANGIRLFPQDMDLSYPNSRGKIPGRPFANDPNKPEEPKSWDIELTPQKGDNWNYIKEAFKNHHTIYFGPGVYPVNVVPRITKHGDLANEEELLVPQSNSHIQFHHDAVIKVNPNNFGDYDRKYAVILIYRRDNVIIENPRIIGDKYHKPENYRKIDSEEWAAGIQIDRGARHIQILNPHITEMWGDGIEDGAGRGSMGSPDDILIANSFLYDNGRNGYSLTASSNTKVYGGIISKTDRTEPLSGIDVEPAQYSRDVSGLKIKDVKFTDGRGLILFKASQDAVIEDIVKLGKGTALISRGTAKEGQTQIHRRWTVGSKEEPTNGSFAIYESRGKKIFEDLIIRNNIGASTFDIQGGRGGELIFDDIYIDGFKAGLSVDNFKKKKENVGDVTFKNAVFKNGNLHDKGRFAVRVITNSKIHIENFKSENTKGFYIGGNPTEIYLKDIEMVKNIGSSTTKNGYIFRVNAVKGTEVHIQNVTVNGIEIPDQSFTAKKDQTVVWLDRKEKFR